MMEYSVLVQRRTHDPSSNIRRTFKDKRDAMEYAQAMRQKGYTIIVTKRQT
jgi:hypothetical protein